MEIVGSNKFFTALIYFIDKLAILLLYYLLC